MNLRLPEELDAALAKIAEAEHTSKHALLLRGAEMVVSSYARDLDFRDGLEFILQRDSGLLRRLEDA